MSQQNLQTLSKSVRASVSAIAGKAAKVETIRTTLGKARQMAEIAEKEIAEAVVEHQSAIETFDRDKGLAALERKNAAIFDRDAAADAVRRLEVEEAAALERDAEEERAARYAEAEKRLETAGTALTDRYPDLAREILSIVRAVAEADLLASQVNKDRPQGAEHLTTIEETLLRSAARRKELGSEIVDVWVFKRSEQILAEEHQSKVRDNGDGTGSVTIATPGVIGGAVGMDRQTSSVVLRRARKTRFLPAGGGYLYDGFASALHLPGFAGEPAIWSPPHDDKPIHVLQHFEDLESKAAKINPRKPEVEIKVLTDEEVAALA